MAKKYLNDLPDETAVEVLLLYHTWKDVIGQTAEQGFKFTYGE